MNRAHTHTYIEKVHHNEQTTNMASVGVFGMNFDRNESANFIELCQ